jgi:hypothetical protein
LPRYDRQPSYFVYCGVVFQPLDTEMLNIWGDKPPPAAFRTAAEGVRTEAQREVVVIGPLLAHAVNAGYEGLAYEVVKSVNGVLPRDLGHLVELIEASGERVEIRTSVNNVLAFDVRDAAAAGREILERYQVPGDRSPDLVARRP